MVEEKFKRLRSNVFNLLEENKALKAELALVKENLNDSILVSQGTINQLQTDSAEKIASIQAESSMTIQSLEEEREIILSRNSELTMHLKRIMSRLESLGIQQGE